MLESAQRHRSTLRQKVQILDSTLPTPTALKQSHQNKIPDLWILCDLSSQQFSILSGRKGGSLSDTDGVTDSDNAFGAGP
jgi:hypothetical protein